jgi:Zn-dependent M28 family amino/carboxypeptidase
LYLRKISLVTGLLTICAVSVTRADEVKTAVVTPSFSTEGFARHVETLASDEFEGRRPATKGEEKTVAYIEKSFRDLGLKPGAGDSYLQPVPFVELTTRAADTIRIAGKGEPFELRYGDEAVYWTKRVVPEVSLDASDLVFVGYGIVDPAQGWNDYAGLDMAGKTAVILVNDPGYATGDAQLFNGRAMTYFGRWTYKYEEASRQGAAAAIVIHEEKPAAYPWAVVQNGAARPQLDIDKPDGNADRVAVEGWMTRDSAVRVMQAAGLDYDEMKARAAKRGFKPVNLGLKASTSVRNAIRRATSYNVIGIVEGARRPDEYVILTAHWDHLGKALAFSGDSVFNGAIDNATGMAALLELARAFSEVRPKPERTVIFAALTGEESGLLGSRYYADNPTVPLASVAGGINIDAIYVYGRTRDVTVVGYGASELEAYLGEAAARQDRVLRPEPTPEKGTYYRSDHFNLAKKGVPMLYAKSGIDSREHGAEWGLAQQADYIANRYHKPSDEFDPNWDLSGAVEDVALYFDVAYRLSNETGFPEWNPGNEFRPVREKSRADATAAK